MTDLGELYRAARLRVGEMTNDGVGEQPVPATPGWTVHDVVSHLYGVVVDVSTGNLDGVTTAPWTAAQVERCRDRSVSHVLADWASAAAGFEEFLSSPAGGNASAAVMDVHCHETDLRTALGLAPALPEEFLGWAGPHLRTAFHRQVETAGLPPVELDASDFEIFRGRLGRRTREQVANLGWSADPTAYLDTFFIFGPTETPVGP